MNINTRVTGDKAFIEVFAMQMNADKSAGKILSLTGELSKVDDSTFLLRILSDQASFRLQWGIYLSGDTRTYTCIDEAGDIVKREWFRIYGRINESILARKNTAA